MSLLESMRSGSDSTFMQVILALVIVSFVFWAGAPSGDMAQTIVVVNGEPITDTEFWRSYRSAESQYPNALTEDQRARLRADVENQLIEQEVVLQEADRLGLQVSDREVARALLEIERFRGSDGRFDRSRYEKFLRASGYTQSGFEDQLRKDLLRGKLRGLVLMGASVSEPVLREAFVEENTKIDVKYVRIRPSAMVDAVTVSPDERAEWLKENAERVDERYQLDLERQYVIPDKAALRVVRLEKKQDGADVRARIDALRAEAETGADLDALARRWSEDPSAAKGGDIGKVALPSLSEPVRAAIGELPPGSLTPVVETERDVAFYAVGEREAGRTLPLDEVRDAIADRLIQEERSPAKAAEFAEQLHAEWKESGVVPDDKLAAVGLVAMDTGLVPLKGEGGAFSPPKEMFAHAGRAVPGEVLPEVYQAGDVLWVGQLENRQDADLERYDAEKDLMRERVLYERRVTLYEDWVADVVARADVKR